MTSIANNDKKLEIINKKIMDIEENLLTIKKELNNSHENDNNLKSTIDEYNDYFHNKEQIKSRQINALNNILSYLNELFNNNIKPDDRKNVEQDIFFLKQTIEKLNSN